MHFLVALLLSLALTGCFNSPPHPSLTAILPEGPGGFAHAPEGTFDIAHVPAPLFRDPIYDGAADPTVVWKADEKVWYILYTNRRANQQLPGVSWVYGTKIGICKSTDNGRSWRYCGTAQGLGRGLDAETFWAPHCFYAGGEYHMYVVYIPLIAVPHWDGKAQIAHYTSPDLIHWADKGLVDVKSDNIIDPGVVQLRDGRWLMVFRDDNGDGINKETKVKTAMCVSDDLKHWTRLQGVVGDKTCEAPVVLFWKDKYWLFVDDWQGIGVYVSDDGIHYARNTTILNAPGKRTEDGVMGGHPGVALAGDKAFIFYFVHPDRNVKHPEITTNTADYRDKRTSLQAAELEVVDGRMMCDRDKYAK